MDKNTASDVIREISHHHGGSRLARLGRLCLKELRECLRDRRTIGTLVLMPLLVYPILTIVFEKFLLTGEAARAMQQIILGVPDEATRQQVQGLLLAGEAELNKQRDRPAEASGVMMWKELQSDVPPEVHFRVAPQIEQLLKDRLIDVAIRTAKPAGEHTGHPSTRPPTVSLELLVQPGSIPGDRAVRFVMDHLDALNQAYLYERLQQLGEPLAVPAEVTVVSTGEEQVSTISLASIIPLVLILMTMTGAVYPAIDTTAGERERGTLEALIATPMPRMALLLAKYVAVVTISMLTATANLVAMTITLYSTGLSSLVLGSGGMSPKILGLSFLLLTLFAFFFSAIVLAVTSFAKSFKEAQAYLIPLILMSLGPSLISLAPGLTLGPGLAVTPLVNMVLLARDIFDGQPLGPTALLVVASSILYAVAALGLAARVFGSDAVLYGSELSWGDMLRRPPRPQTHLKTHTAVLTLAFLLPVYILAAGLVARGGAQHLPSLIVASCLVTTLLFGAVPTFVTWFQRVPLPEGFRLHGASWGSWLGAVLIGVGLWPLVLLASHTLSASTWRLDQLRAGQELVERFRGLPFPLVLLGFALIPAVFEEWFFRGFLFSSFLGASTPKKAIWASAFLFGGFHVVSGALSVGRFLPSTCVGLVLGWVCWTTRSIFPGIVLHALHNAALLTLARFAPQWEAQGLTVTSSKWLIGAVLVSSAGCLLGALLIRMSSSKKEHSP